MTRIEEVVLLGLRKYGKSKRIAEILDEANIPHTPASRLELAVSLEGQGLIENVVYQLPLNIRGELSGYGRQVADSLDAGPGSSGLEGLANALIVFQALKLYALENSYILLLL